MNTDIWHYPRHHLAQQLLGMFDSGLSSALVFFAPRRMGKTEFLLQDMLPLATTRQHWHAQYFSFLDASTNPSEAFTLALIELASKLGIVKGKKLQKQIKSLSVGALGAHVGIAFRDTQITLKEIIAAIAAHDCKLLLLLDEVQALAVSEKNKDFIAALRTALDRHKNTVKVIFTGSSQEGLRRMFAKSDAPFFHFGQNLPFPEFGEDFTQHLACVFEKVTQRSIDTKELWAIFVALGKVPQLIRALVEQLVLQPHLTLAQAKEQLLQTIKEDREYATLWQQATLLEQLLLKTIAKQEKALFSKAKRAQLAKRIGIASIAVSSLQSALRSLQRKKIIVHCSQRGIYAIDDPNFKNWLQNIVIDDP